MSVVNITSSAFPNDHLPSEHSTVHAYLRQPHQLVSINIRLFQPEDLSQIVCLHREWFPLEYSTSFYNRIKDQKVVCQVAEAVVKHSDKLGKVIVGILVYQLAAAGDLLRVQKWSDYFYGSSQSMYIMTLGVIDEFRNRGIGKLFLAELIRETESNPNIKYIDLHVVAYNSASMFYEKNQFQMVEYLYNFYDNIRGRSEDAKRYARFFNGGARKVGWMQWARSFLG